ncbi:MAG: hypothetical protein P4M08_10715 [Oligoflexia bacterium]|nr:hypothetical protein [Oligoflexia bacterium]
MKPELLRRLANYLLVAIPIFAALWVWLSALSFVPVPWPDDSAFYFVARELFKWPPRWVMLPQAPFEPTYRIWNFNTMPLYPLLIGFARLIGIDGIWALKILPLGFWAASGSVLAWMLRRAQLPWLFTLSVILAFAMDPTLRWASVLLRPESLIGLCGMILVLELCLPRPPNAAPDTDWPHWYRDKIAILLALAAYAHFNAVHLVFPVLAAYAFRPKRLISVAAHTSLFLVPWALTVLWHFKLFVYQMGVQWERLAVPNGWLSSVNSALQGMFQSLGSPIAWPADLIYASYWLWLLVFLAGLGVAYVIYAFFFLPQPDPKLPQVQLAPASAWVASSLWLWHNKPEVWFTYYLHEAIWCFAGVLMLDLYLRKNARERALNWGLCAGTAACGLLFLGVNWLQASELSNTRTWNWKAYHDFVDCIDRQLTFKEAWNTAHPKPGSSSPVFQVWDPTFPDVTVELSRRHPNWDLTRTNDFQSRTQLALHHGDEVDAVVITEMLNWPERWIESPMDEHPEIPSVWMTWKEYYLYHLLDNRAWKLDRHLCQVGRWQAFIYMK